MSDFYKNGHLYFIDNSQDTSWSWRSVKQRPLLPQDMYHYTIRMNTLLHPKYLYKCIDGSPQYVGNRFFTMQTVTEGNLYEDITPEGQNYKNYIIIKDDRGKGKLYPKRAFRRQNWEPSEVCDE